MDTSKSTELPIPKGAIMPSDRKIEGILMPMPVAFKKDGAIDHAGTDAIIDFYLDAGVHGFFPLGTHGQGMVMEIDERKKMAEQIVNRVRGRVPVVMHIGAPNTLAGIKVSFIAYDKLLGYVFQLPKSVGVFPGGIFSLYSGYSVGVRGAIHPPSTPFPETCVKMYEALKSGDLKAAQKEHDLLAALMQVVGRFLRTHGRGVFCELLRLRGLPVERFPRWETPPFTDKDRTDLKEGLAKAGYAL